MNLHRIYGNAKNRSDFGKHQIWPACSKSFLKLDDYMKKLYIRWRCFMVLRPYPPNLRTEMYLLSISCELIKNRQISSNLVQKWKGNYLADSAENSKCHVFNNAMKSLQASDNFNRILFSSFIQKMNRHFKTQSRVIVVTDKYLYRLDEKYKVCKNPIPLTDIVKARVNDESDNQLIVLSFKDSKHDSVFYLDAKKSSDIFDRVPEFLANIYRIQLNNANKLEVDVSQTVHCRVESKDKSIIVRNHGKKIEFKKHGDSISLNLPSF